MLVLARALTYATLFVGLLLVFLPARVLSWSGIGPPTTIGVPQVGGLVLGAAGATLALWCVMTFALVGRGTPAPFDPPRHLVVRGPYRAVRNPMYLGAGLALAAAALFYQSFVLLAYTVLFLLATHLFVIWYEEPTLRRTFGADYEAYCRRVSRWSPRLPTSQGPGAGAPLDIILFAAGALAACAAACGGPTEIALGIVQVEGTVTSTADGRPIEGVGVVLTYPIMGGSGGRGRSATSWTDSLGRYAVSLTDLACLPGTLDLGVALPTGYRFPADLTPASIACVEEVQVWDFQLEPVP